MDTCESGEVDEGNATHRLAAMERRSGLVARGIKRMQKVKASSTPQRRYLFDRDRFIYNDLSRRAGAVVFSSSQGSEHSYESPEIENCFFTKEILRVLGSSSADKDKDGVVSVRELQAEVSESVPRLTNDLQHPTVDRDNIFIKFGFPAR